jgi:hypothetical protein
MKVLSYNNSKKKKVEVQISEFIVLTWKFLGKVKDGEQQDGFRVVPFSTKFNNLLVSLVQQGKDNDDIILDINKSDSTLIAGSSDNTLSFSSIYTTQANRPIFTGVDSNKDDPVVYMANTPDIINYPANSVFSLDIDSEGKQAEDLIVQLYLEKT